MEDNKSSDLFQRIPDALLVAFLTAGVYWIAFRYEAAYLKVFGFPIHLANVSIEAILVVLLILSGSLWSLFLCANLVSMHWPSHPALQVKVVRIVLLLAFPAWNLTNYGYRKEDLIYYSIVFAIILLLEFIWPLFVFRDKKNLREKFIADEIAEAEPKSKTLFGRFHGVIGTAGYNIVLLIFLGGIFAAAAGRAKATTQELYIVSVSDPTIAVIRLYKDRALCVRFDPEKHTFSGIVMNHYTANSTEFKEVKIGPLSKLEKEK